MKIIFVLSMIVTASTAFASNYNCSYSSRGQSYLLEIINDLGSRGEVAILMMNKDKKPFAFSSSEISTIKEVSGEFPYVKAQLGNSNLMIMYDWGNDPNAMAFKIQVTGEIPSIGFPPKPSLPNLEISQTFKCSYF